MFCSQTIVHTLKSKVQTGHTAVGRQLGKWHHKGDRTGVLALLYC